MKRTSTLSHSTCLAFSLATLCSSIHAEEEVLSQTDLAAQQDQAQLDRAQARARTADINRRVQWHKDDYAQEKSSIKADPSLTSVDARDAKLDTAKIAFETDVAGLAAQRKEQQTKIDTTDTALNTLQTVKAGGGYVSDTDLARTWSSHPGKLKLRMTTFFDTLKTTGSLIQAFKDAFNVVTIAKSTAFQAFTHQVSAASSFEEKLNSYNEQLQNISNPALRKTTEALIAKTRTALAQTRDKITDHLISMLRLSDHSAVASAIDAQAPKLDAAAAAHDTAAQSITVKDATRADLFSVNNTVAGHLATQSKALADARAPRAAISQTVRAELASGLVDKLIAEYSALTPHTALPQATKQAATTALLKL